MREDKKSLKRKLDQLDSWNHVRKVYLSKQAALFFFANRREPETLEQLKSDQKEKQRTARCGIFVLDEESLTWSTQLVGSRDADSHQAPWQKSHDIYIIQRATMAAFACRVQC
jgi:hypothetical protein